MKRLLFVSNLFPLPWQPGRGVFNLQQVEHLARHVELLVLVPVPWYVWWRRPRSERRPFQLSSRVRVVTFPHWYLPRLLRNQYARLMWFSLLPWMSTVRRFRPDGVVGSWLYPDGVAAANLARRLDCPLVLKAHGSDVNLHCRVPERARQVDIAAHQARALYTVSDALAGVLAENHVNTERQVTLYNGIDLERFQPGDRAQAREALGLEPNGRILLFVGNVIEAKGVVELIDALARMHTADTRLVMIGDGAAEARVDERVAALGLDARVMRPGRLPHHQLVRWMCAADVLVLPSHGEGVPNVVLEAMACGRPVVATEVGGIPEVLPDSAGLLVPPGDPARLAAALDRVLAADWDERLIRQHAEQFTWEDNVAALLQLFGWPEPGQPAP